MHTNLPTSSAPETVPADPVRAEFIGLDLSLTDTGVGHITPDGHVTVWRIKSKAPKTDDLRSRANRLSNHVAAILDSLPAGSDIIITVEGPAFASTSSHAHDMGGLWWLVVNELVSERRVVHVAPPANVKQYATGKGNAAKDEVLAQVIRRYPAAVVSNNNEADALVLAAMGARHHGHPVDDMPQRHIDALAKVRWAA